MERVVKLRRLRVSDLSLAELFLEVVELSQGALTAALLFGWRADRGAEGGRFWVRRFWTETNPADVEVFLEAVELEEIG